jgi:dUTPase
MSLQKRYSWATPYRTEKLPVGLVQALSNIGDNHYADSSPIPTTENLNHTTPGSTGLDFSPTSQYILTPDLGEQIIPMGVYGPLPQDTVGLILGKSSATIRGLQVYPGVINEDYTEEIKIMTQAPDVFVAVSLEIKIAQLVIPLNMKKSKVLTHIWRIGGFGSSNQVFWLQQVTKDRPEMTLFLNGKCFGEFWILLLMSL